MILEYAAALPLVGALENMDGIEFGQWSVRDAWRQPEIDSDKNQEQTAEIDTRLNKVWLRDPVFNKKNYYIKEAAFRIPGTPPEGQSVEIN